MDDPNNHECAWIEHKFWEDKENRDGYGVAIDSVVRSQFHGGWWAGNGEYSSRIFYCPFCGVKLE